MAITFGLAAGLGVATWFLTLILLVRRHHDRLPRKVLTWIVRAMGLILVGLALWSAVDLIRDIVG